MTTTTEKGIDEILHTVQRLRERWGLDIRPEDYRRACEDIRWGRAVRVYRSSETYTHWLVRIKSRVIPVIYNQHTGNIATALPSSALWNDEYVPVISRLVGQAAAARTGE